MAQTGGDIGIDPVEQPLFARFGPAVHRQAPVARRVLPGVERDHQPLGAKIVQPAMDPLGFAHGQRADHHPRRAGGKNAFDVRAFTHATAGLHPQAGLGANAAQ